MHSQRHVDRQNIHTIGGVEGDLSNSLTDDGCKVRVIGIEAQLGTMPNLMRKPSSPGIPVASYDKAQ